jgi:hypothetical protein
VFLKVYIVVRTLELLTKINRVEGIEEAKSHIMHVFGV